MFAIDHAATALLVKRRFPSVPMVPLLCRRGDGTRLGRTQLPRHRRTITGPVLRSVADIHLAYMPCSHSVGTAVGAAVVVWRIIE